MVLLSRLRARLGDPCALRWIVVLAVVLLLPALTVGFILDDHGQQLMLRGAPGMERSPLDLYSFLLEDPEWRAAMREHGGLAWYVDPEIRARLWRPLTALTLQLDFLLAPGSAVFGHLHSLVWCAALFLVVGLLYRQQLAPPWIAGLATLLYAVDDGHSMSAAFIANRNAMVSMVFATLALLLHIQWRRDGRRRAGWLAPVFLGLGLLGGEMALAITAYLFAYAVVLDRGSWWRRLTTLLPAVLTSLAWVVTYRALGFGTANSGLYIDPVNDPWRYAVACVERVPQLLQGQLTPVPAETAFILSDRASLVLTASAAIALVAMGLVLWPWLRSSAQARFWALGMGISLLPVCATFAYDRLLFPVSLGGFALVAMVIGGVHDRATATAPAYWSRRSVRWLAGFWTITHLILAPVILPFRTYGMRFFGQVFEDNARSMDNLPGLPGRTLVVVRSPDLFMTSWALLIRQNLGLPTPDRLRLLGTTLGQVEVTRIDDRTLRLRAPGGFVTMPLDRIMRSYDRPFSVGETVAVSDLSVEVTAITPEGRPAELRCRFTQVLEHGSYLWAHRSINGYQPFELPPPGGTVTLAELTIWEMLRYRFEP